MSEPRDWDKELAEIDRLMGVDSGAKNPPPTPAPASLPRGGDAPQTARSSAPAPAPATGRSARGTAATWLVALLGPLGAVALAIWPYPKACGTGLLLYLVGVLAVFGASIWTMRLAWTGRRAAAMVVGIVTLIAALALAALEVSPRVGYARTSLTWTCTT